MNKDTLKDLLLTVMPAEKMIGIDPVDIAHIEQTKKLKLPQLYIDFLLLVGSDKTKFFRHKGFLLYPSDLGVQESLLDESLDDYDPLYIPENGYIFETYQCEIFWFFNCDGMDDPQVYKIEYEEEPEPTGLTLSEYFIARRDGILAGRKREAWLEPLTLLTSWGPWGQRLGDEKDLARAILAVKNDSTLVAELKDTDINSFDLMHCLGNVKSTQLAHSLEALILENGYKRTTVLSALDNTSSEIGKRSLKCLLERLNNLQ